MADEQTNATAPTTPTDAVPDTTAQANAAAATAHAEAAKVIDAEDTALLATLTGETPAPAAADDGDEDDAKPANGAKPAKPAAEEAETGDADPLEGLDIPGVKKAAKPAGPDAERLAIARGRMALEAQGLSEEDIDALTPAKLTAIGQRAIAADPVAKDQPEPAEAAAAAPEPVKVDTAELDSLLNNGLLDTEEAGKVRAAFTKTVQATVAAQVKAATAQHVKTLQDEVARAQEATSGMLKMRFHTAFAPLVTDFPQLKDKAVARQVLEAMDKLDPRTEIAYGSDDHAFNRLLRQAVYVALGDKIAGAARQATVTKGKKQARGVAEAPVGGASAAKSQRSVSDDDDKLIDQIRAGDGPGQQMVGLTPIKLAKRDS
jgi:hypothetical protein